MSPEQVRAALKVGELAQVAILHGEHSRYYGSGLCGGWRWMMVDELTDSSVFGRLLMAHCDQVPSWDRWKQYYGHWPDARFQGWLPLAAITDVRPHGMDHRDLKAYVRLLPPREKPVEVTR